MRSIDQFRRTKSALALAAAVTVFVGVLLGGCHSDSGTTVAAPIVPSFSVGGNVAGLATGAQVTLLNNGGDSLTISADGKFAFPTLIADNGGYSVTVGTQPPDEHCSVAAGTGTNVQAAVTTVAVTCVTHNLYVGDTGAPKIYQYATGTGAISQLATPSVTTTGNIGNLILDNSRNYLYATIPSMNVVAQFNIGVDGSLTPMTTATVASGGTSPYEEALSPNGKWLFVGDQGNETVDSFAIGVDGSLTHVGTYS